MGLLIGLRIRKSVSEIGRFIAGTAIDEIGPKSGAKLLELH
ncbi:hypothetical protein OO009_14640 [Flavobacteriaceae bacterium KMM 6897]|nr:hypothetical protein [Flavobacteriaceae bacterium KMM 6897]MEB8347337.1 hypothetical protein [Flavobacteriaceae bacterium KMM 6898]